MKLFSILVFRNIYLTIYYSKWRTVLIFIMLTMMIILCKRDQVSGMTSLLYGASLDTEGESFPLFWFIFVISPALAIGNSQMLLWKSDFKILHNIGYKNYLFSNLLMLGIYNSLFYFLIVIINGFGISHLAFYSYLFIFSFTYLVLLSTASFLLDDFILPLIGSLAVIILDVYTSHISIIDATMLSRFNPNHNSINIVILLTIILSCIVISLIKIKDIDFI